MIDHSVAIETITADLLDGAAQWRLRCALRRLIAKSLRVLPSQVIIHHEQQRWPPEPE